MLLQNLLNATSNNSLKNTNFFSSIIEFLQSHMGSKIMAWVTIGIILALTVAFIICTIIAICNPSKRKMKKLNKTLKRQAEYDATRQRIFELSEQIGFVNLELRMIKKQLDDDIFNLSEIERSAFHQDKLYIENVKQQMDDLAEKQAILNEVFETQKKGLLKTIKKDKAESAKLLIDELVQKQRKLHNEIYWKNVDIEKRKAQLLYDIENLTTCHNAKTDELLVKLNKLEEEKLSLEQKLEKMNKQGRHKLTFADAKAMTDDFAKRKKLEDKVFEDAALAELKKAKEEYEEACKKRALAEKNKELAVENVKTIQKGLAKSKNTKRVKFAPLTEAQAVISEDKPDDVNIIISDINSQAIFTPLVAEETILEENKELPYEEPIVEVVDITQIPEEDVVFIEAFLDDLDFSSEDDVLEEVAISAETTENLEQLQDVQPIVDVIEEESTSSQNEEQSQNDDSLVLSNEEHSSLEENNPLEETTRDNDFETQEINIENQQDNLLTQENCEETTKSDDCNQESAVDVQDENFVTDVEKTEHSQENKVVYLAKKQPAYKDYNDGIPATPIYKTSKYQKPTTKLVKKPKPLSNAPSSTDNDKGNNSKTPYNGKWKINEKDGKFFATLIASNGSELLSTPNYTSIASVKSCIENVKSCLMEERISIATDKTGKFFFKVTSLAGRTITQSSKYSSKYQCEKSLASAKRFAQTATII